MVFPSLQLRYRRYVNMLQFFSTMCKYVLFLGWENHQIIHFHPGQGRVDALARVLLNYSWTYIKFYTRQIGHKLYVKIRSTNGHQTRFSIFHILKIQTKPDQESNKKMGINSCQDPRPQHEFSPVFRLLLTGID